jgi:hypothetical protein
LRVGLFTPLGAGIAVVLPPICCRNARSALTVCVCVAGSPFDMKMMKLRPHEALAGLLYWVEPGTNAFGSNEGVSRPYCAAPPLNHR